MKKKTALTLGIAWLLIMVAIVASSLTLFLTGSGVGERHWVSSDQYEALERYARLDQVRAALVDSYYQPVDEDALLQGAIDGMMAALEDPYTFYYTPDEMSAHNEASEGVYHGLGLLLQNNAQGDIEIVRVYEDSPSARAGALVGDVIAAVDGAAVSGENSAALAEATRRMKGEDGTTVALTIRRAGEYVELRMVRGHVSVSNVRYSMLEGGVGYIDIFQFTGDDVTAFTAALEALEADGARALVIDLRNNPGGLLTDVVAIADLILPEGRVVSIQDRDGRRSDYYSDARHCDLPLTVLINGMSASASEILAAAVQDHARGTVIGTQSYGKGIVQSLIGFEDDGAGMQYTSACYYTPNGRSIHGTGVTPDLTIEASNFSDLSGVPDPENDPQLRAALARIIKETASDGA